MASAQLVFWYDLASNYSYLTAVRIEELCHQANLKLIWRPFLLGPIFKQNGWHSSPFNMFRDKGRYMMRDMERLTQKRELPPFKMPLSFPQNSLLPARIATLGSDSNWIGAYSRQVFNRQFAQADSIETEDFHRKLLDTMNLPGAELVAKASTKAVKDQLRTVTSTAMELHIFGAPSFTTDDGELFWGDDRLEDAIDWASSLA